MLIYFNDLMPQLSPVANKLKQTDRLLDFFAVLSSVLPRGKGAVVRRLGKLLVAPDSKYMITRDGAMLVLSPDSLDVYTTMRKAGNAWDYWDFMVCTDSLLDGQVFYEVGANVGYFCIEMGQLREDKIKVLGFEPQTGPALAIARSIELNDFHNVKIINALVGDTTKQAKFFIAPATIHSSAVDDSNRPIARTAQSQMFAIDDLVDSGAIPGPDFVKMDVEGSEHLVFIGAKNTFRKYKPNIYIEYVVQDDQKGRIREQIDSLIADAGCYDIYCSAQADRRHLYPQRLFKFESIADLNIADAIYLRNRERPVQNAQMFGS